MRTVVLCWELGAGFGHLTTLLPVARALRERGDQVVLIARNLWSAGQVFRDEIFRDEPVTLLQAPFRHGSALQYDATPTFAYILHNIGFSDSTGLACLASGWRNLFKVVRPDLIIADHSPTALLAARGLGLPSIVWGTGFYCPPDETPLPPLTPIRYDADQARVVEATVRDRINDVLTGWGATPIDRLPDLYHDGPRRFLLTFPELDHYPNRRGDRHRGYWPYGPGIAPDWPTGAGPRIFVYLKHFPRLPQVLDAIVRLKLPTLAYLDGAEPELRKRYERTTLRFADGMVDLRVVATKAVVGVTNANIGTMTALLLGGIPQLCLPLTLEQSLVGRAVERMGAGLNFPSDGRRTLDQTMRALLTDGRFRTAARAFADRHREFGADCQMDELLAECNVASTRDAISIGRNKRPLRP